MIAGWANWVVAAGLAPVPVQWDAPEQCRPQAGVEAALVEFGIDDAPQAAAHAVDARVRAVESGWSAELAIRTPDGPLRRVLVDAECETLARAIALVVAVTIDPFGLRPIEGAGAPPPSTDDVVPVPPLRSGPTAVVATGPAREDAAAGPPPPRRRRIVEGGSFWIAGALDIGMFPRVFGGAAIGLALRLRSARLELGALGLAPRRLEHPANASAAANVRLAVGQLRGCWAPQWRTLEVPLCAGVEAGAMIAEGRDLVRTGTARSPWVAVTFGPRLLWSFVQPLALVVGIEGAIALAQPGFVVDDLDGELARARAGSFRAFAGIEWRFPDENRRGRR